MKESKMSDIVVNYFIEKGELFRRIMDSRIMTMRAKKIAKGIAKQLMMLGIEKGYVLDVGCGTGRIALELAEIGYNVVGIDISPIYIDIASERAKSRGLNNRVTFILCDARFIDQCNFDSMRFDAVIFVWSSVIGYYDEETDVRILSTIRNMVKDSGVLMFVDFVNKDYLVMELGLIGPRLVVYDYDDVIVLEHTIFNPVVSEILIKQRFYRKEGLNYIFLDEAMFRMRIYSLSELVDIARRSGWCIHKVLKDVEGEPGYTPLKPLNIIFTLCREQENAR
ncbi:MAG: methyltransferase domain-containing protein [Ignisphaera sp.]